MLLVLPKRKTKILSEVSPTRESIDFQRLDGKSLIQSSKFSISVGLKDADGKPTERRVAGGKKRMKLMGPEQTAMLMA